MKILMMPDSFKGSISAKKAAMILGKSFEQVFPAATIDLLPVGDGGEGTLDALSQNILMEEKSQIVSGWNEQPFSMRYMCFQDQAFFEMADLVGLPMFSEEQRQPLDIMTVGLGELILQLQAAGIQKIYIGVGGSATVDGGIGLAAGLGYRFYDREDNLLQPIGRNLGRVARIDTTNVPKLTAKIYAVTDVKNVLCGENGASPIFGPQKGLTAEEISVTDQALKQFYHLIDPKLADIPGSGAGGGLAAGIVGFAGGKIVHGIDFVLDVLDFDQHVRDADFIIVGEGKIDQQSMAGKAPVGIAQRAPKTATVLAICGSVDQQIVDFQDYGITACFPIIGQPGSLNEVLENAEQNLERTGINIARLIKSIRSKEFD
ncbi:glycerate kinase [Enterococcus xiangfangensis]|uniref:glycerate kinase n=1 Tax=Enterococcus xiangfangensis TaxID=1296537 RepID=UPI0010F9D349|nr:glycerate kinase [Enterococcus xiangfangensis]MBM7711122.1 glycerate kinase [Enterococcus xiangfangensis]NBK07706.1 glycerate kinase [Enterococcus asini]